MKPEKLVGLVGKWISWVDGFGVTRRGKLCQLTFTEFGVIVTVNQNPAYGNTETMYLFRLKDVQAA